MTDTVQGIVEYLDLGDTGFWSAKIGNERFGCGKYEPKFKIGDEVSFDFTKRESGGRMYNNMQFGTVKILEKGVANSTSSSGQTGGGMKATNWDEKDKRISFLACRKDALVLAGLALEHKAFVMPTKAADKLETLQSFVDTLTLDLYSGVYNEPYEVS